MILTQISGGFSPTASEENANASIQSTVTVSDTSVELIAADTTCLETLIQNRSKTDFLYVRNVTRPTDDATLTNTFIVPPLGSINLLGFKAIQRVVAITETGRTVNVIIEKSIIATIQA